MGLPRRYMVPHDCLSCTLRQRGDFCNLHQPVMTEFSGMGHLTFYPANAVLLTEGQIPGASTSPVPAAPSSRWRPAMARRSS